VRVRGKTVPTRIFELLGRTGDPALRPEVVSAFEQALELYHQRRFAEAGDRFARCASELDDPVGAVYLARCRRYAAAPPPSDWDGVFELK
jgi:adenylate cyclase